MELRKPGTPREGGHTTYGDVPKDLRHYYDDTISDDEVSTICALLPVELQERLKLTVHYARSWIGEH